ncbi:MAG: DUF4924 family protein [Muribaculaceae bacterium]|nr:DUF4924 family protein [Muribaculaceae bacterium]
MLIAQAKRKENIAEYLLYMWQVEDLIRANHCDIDEVQRNVIDRFQVDDDTRHEMREWYDSLIKMMELEHVKQNGHLQINKNVLIRLNDLHRLLLQSPKFPEYGAQYYQALPFIVELRAKAPEGKQVDELETCFQALYGVLLLKLQGKEISKETEKAIGHISYFLGMLAAYYKKDEAGELFDENDNLND